MVRILYHSKSITSSFIFVFLLTLLMKTNFEFYYDLDCYDMKTVWEAVELKVAPQKIRYCHTRSRIYSCASSSQRQIVRTSLWNIIESIVTHEMTGKSADSSYAMERWFRETRSSAWNWSRHSGRLLLHYILTCVSFGRGLTLLMHLISFLSYFMHVNE